MNGVKVKFLDRDEILQGLKSRARQLLTSNSEVLEVSLFGSLARGNYAPGSDADLYILLKHHPGNWIDRIPEFLLHFSGIGVPVEVFPYTVEELVNMGDTGFIQSIQKEKIVLASWSD